MEMMMSDTRRILFVHPVTQMSIGDVARGYRRALARQGHEIADYNLGARVAYHQKAIPAEVLARPEGIRALAHQSSETIVCEALYHRADLVIIVSGLNVHPIALWLLNKVNIPVAVILTESPYDDEQQSMWTDLIHVDGVAGDITVFTNDRYSADKYGWQFLPPSYDPAIHKPTEPDPEFECDVLMVGTGWPERQRFLEAVDWAGIDLRLYGIWENIGPDSPLHQFYYPTIISNTTVPRMYCSAKININIHRASDVALTPGPRAYELAACGAFQLSDPREDLKTLFRDSVPTFRNPAELGEMVRHYLTQPEERRLLAAKSLDAVCDEDFDKRAATLIATMSNPDRNSPTALVGQQKETV